MIAANVLPVSEYTRITIESNQAIAHSVLILSNPDRIVLDLKNTSINQPLKALANKVLPDDFYIKKVRVANFKQGILRIVVDLKATAKPKLSVYLPASGYQHRLALDIYPAKAKENIAESSTNEESAAADISPNSYGAGIVLEPNPIFESNPIFEPEADLPNDIE